MANDNTMLKFTGVMSEPETLTGTLNGELVRGYSAYDIAVQLGFEGTPEEWLEYLKGEKGDKGDSVDINVVKDTSDEYIIEFSTPDKTIESPNLKTKLIKGRDYMTEEDIEEIYDIYNQRFSSMLDNKVDKEPGKILSTNDYTDEDQTKLAGIEDSAQVNLIEKIKVNDVEQEIVNKAVSISIPTNNNQLTNGAGYQTSSDVASAISDSLATYKTSDEIDDTISTAIANSLTNYRTSDEIDSAISTAINNSPHLKKVIVAELPNEGVENTIYLLPNNTTGNNTKDEYIWVNNGWEKIGGSDIDLSDYAQISDLNDLIDDTSTSTDKTWSASKISSELENAGSVKDIFIDGNSVVNAQGIAEIPNMSESAEITVSGTDPVIQALSNTRYMCGEVLSLDFTPSVSGICEVIFTSGTTPTVLTLPPTVMRPEWFKVEANHVYDISIIDGVYGTVMVW